MSIHAHPFNQLWSEPWHLFESQQISHDILIQLILNIKKHLLER